MAVRDFKKFFKRRERFVRQPRNNKKTFQRSRDDKNGKSDRKCFRFGDPNNLIGECPKPPKDKNQKAFVEGSWNDSSEEDDEKCRVTFSKHDSEITKDGKVIGRGIRKKSLFVMKLGNKSKDQICLTIIDENSTLWHRRLGHANMRLIQSLASKDLVRNLSKIKFDQHFCDACKIGKQAHASHKAKNIVSTTRCIELLHMDIFGPSAVRSYEGNRYTLVIADDYSREFCNVNGIAHNFSAPRTPQSNGVVERKNRELQEMSMKPTLDYFRVFGSKCFILNTKDYLTKFDPKSYEGIFLGYSQNSKAYIILNKHTRKVKESLNVTFDETPPPSKTSPLVDDDLDEEEEIKVTEKKNLKNDIEDETLEIDEIVNIKESRNHPLENHMLKKFGLDESKPMKTHMSSDTKLTKDEECESVDSTKYRGMIEYAALLAGIRIAAVIKVQDLTMFIDSQLVANQVKGLFEARQPFIKQYLDKTREVLKGFHNYLMDHVRRDHNKKADALSKLALMAFSRLAKEVLVEVLHEKLIIQKEVADIIKKEGENWMLPIREYLLFGTLPRDQHKAKKLRIKDLYKPRASLTRYTKDHVECMQDHYQ
ncbi:retrovirus-related pol polyprotein from transposon TNT 1-94, partial [Tanacetum coccineum]